MRLVIEFQNHYLNKILEVHSLNRKNKIHIFLVISNLISCVHFKGAQGSVVPGQLWPLQCSGAGRGQYSSVRAGVKIMKFCLLLCVIFSRRSAGWTNIPTAKTWTRQGEEEMVICLYLCNPPCLVGFSGTSFTCLTWGIWTRRRSWGLYRALHNVCPTPTHMLCTLNFA